MLNDEESIQLTEETNLNKIADNFLGLGPKIVIIKKGSKGSLIAYKNQQIEVSVVPKTKLIDPTGAGDSFAGGVLGYMSINGIDNPLQAVLHGTAIASYTVSSFGVDNLSKIDEKDLYNKINQITYNRIKY